MECKKQDYQVFIHDIPSPEVTLTKSLENDGFLISTEVSEDTIHVSPLMKDGTFCSSRCINSLKKQ